MERGGGLNLIFSMRWISIVPCSHVGWVLSKDLWGVSLGRALAGGVNALIGPFQPFLYSYFWSLSGGRLGQFCIIIFFVYFGTLGGFGLMVCSFNIHGSS